MKVPQREKDAAEGKETTPASARPGARVYWIVGDRLLVEEHWRSLVQGAEVVRFDGRKLDIVALAREIDTLPMFVEHKWILVQEFRPPGKRSTDGEAPSKGDAEGDKELLSALGRVGPAVTVILVSETGDKRTKLAKLVESLGGYIELPGFREYETARLAEWAAARLASHGKR
ncbi:MAG: hypothetical protein LC772_10440, partial [Chloroflexi bacterium]|nr:hypothetical protein [Chloroflexota bacterium]